MASFWYQKGIEQLLLGNYDLTSAAVKIMLTATAYTPDKDHDDIADLTEVANGTGYTGGFGGAGRKVVATPTVNLDDVNDLVWFDGDDPLWTALDIGGVGGVAEGAALVIEDTADVSSPLLCYIDTGGFPYTSSGVDFKIAIAATGICKIST